MVCTCLATFGVLQDLLSVAAHFVTIASISQLIYFSTKVLGNETFYSISTELSARGTFGARTRHDVCNEDRDALVHYVMVIAMQTSRLLLLISLAETASAASLNVDDTKEPPAEFHTRCVTFCNSVIAEAQGSPDKVAKVLMGRCGEKHAGLETARAHTTSKARCQATSDQLVNSMRKATEDINDHKWLVSSSYVVRRHNKFYEAVSNWCRELYEMREHRQWPTSRNAEVALTRATPKPMPMQRQMYSLASTSRSALTFLLLILRVAIASETRP